MARYFLALVLIAAFSAGVTAGRRAAAQAALRATKAIAFIGVNVVPMTRDGVTAAQTVIVESGRITTIGPEATTVVPERALRIDGRGKFLMPGLADMHAHLPPGDGTPGDAADAHMQLYLANERHDRPRNDGAALQYPASRPHCSR